MNAIETAPLPPRANPWRRTVIFSALALAVFFGLRWLPLSGGALHYTDFHADGKNILEFCEPGSPQFVPVDRVRSPVSLELRVSAPPRTGEPVRITAKLTASSGKPVTTDDLLVVHTEKLHLLIVDASLEDYQHIHPRPTGVAGEFVFDFTPRRGGTYRVFADFTPRATGRALYAGAALNVSLTSDLVGAALERSRENVEFLDTTLDGYRFTLTPAKLPLHTNVQNEITFTIAREDAGNVAPVVLEDIMGASAHLVAFDEHCTGFAHLHPVASSDPSRLVFTLLLSDPGFYRLWAQLKIEGRERFVPFVLRVEP